MSSSSPQLDPTFGLYSTGVVLGVMGTLHVLKRSSLVGSLLGGWFSFSKKNAILGLLRGEWMDGTFTLWATIFFKTMGFLTGAARGAFGQMSGRVLGRSEPDFRWDLRRD